MSTYGVTDLNAPTILATGALILLTFLLGRRHTLTPLIIAIAILPNAQRFVVGGLDFSMVRTLMIMSWIAVLLGAHRGTFRWSRMNAIDIALVFWAISAMVIYVIRRGDTAAITYKAGILLDVFGIYFLVRHRVWQLEQIVTCLVVCAYLNAPRAPKIASIRYLGPCVHSAIIICSSNAPKVPAIMG